MRGVLRNNVGRKGWYKCSHLLFIINDSTASADSFSLCPVFTSVHDLVLVAPVDRFDELVDVAAYFIGRCSGGQFL